MSIFEKLKEMTGCENILDIKFKPNISRVLNALCEIKLSDYPVSELQELAEYIYGEKQKFECAYDAECYFKEKLYNEIKH